MGREKILGIHYLRGIAALMVVFYHLRTTLNHVYAQSDLGDIMFSYGAFGVDLFFVISGYIICYSTEKKERYMRIKYIVRRVFRIYPLLITSLLFTFFFVSDESNISALIRSAVPLNTNYSAGSPFFGYNLLSPAWTLTYEIAFYIIFLVSFAFSHKYRWLISSVIIILFVCGIQKWQTGNIILNAYNSNSFKNGTIWHAPLTFLASPLFLDFVYGVVIYKIHNVIKKMRVTENVITWIKACSLFIFAISFLEICSTQVYGHGPLLWGLWCAILILSGLVYENFGTIPKSRILCFLGDISYSLYLTHAVIIDMFYKYNNIFSIFGKANGISHVLYILILSLFLAYMVYKLIELPFIKIGKLINNGVFDKNCGVNF
ncbi:acyltransferase [Salmonella enterica]|uniref:Acyltransferase n=1 Tax=Salmonella enterica TaxID=28901 RepID=A0A5U2NKR9_SALER|nr:acyltransferase [Salmonella enterica]ECB7315452.1 acyltransferase [Salmonella enterica subsp. enterica serovar Treforest]EED3698794.1 acyltransferase [Salmonella enterica subsp. enterica]EHI8594933.1 acyltransferase [Salmonella enterica subsp. enterica serovar 51:z:1,5]HCB5520478.1 acyltransferase [Salmonella enterica subsp. enterica serovar Poona]EBP1415266.1 acyltransferase [Salmonella enterica]